MAGNPVVLIHGIMGQRHVYWNLFKHRLRSDRFRVQEAIIPWGGMGDMRIAASILQEKVDAVLRHSDARKVDLVCHSAGGLVARYYLMYLGGDKKVEDVVFLGTPHQGTYFSYTLPVPLLEIARQSRPGSHFLEEINGPGAIPPGVTFHNLWSPIDLVVIPAANSKLPGSKAIRMPLVSHWGFLWRRDVYETVRDLLRGDEPKPAGTGAGDEEE